MNYLLDKKIKKNKFSYLIVFVIILLVLFYFRSSIYNGFALLSHTVFRPVLILGSGVGQKLGSISSYFTSKNSLYLENQNLKSELDQAKALMSNYDSILIENTSLKEILSRSDERSMTLSAILSKPNKSLYDTLIIDAGLREGFQIGDTVFALGDVPIGRISEVYPNSTKVVLFSTGGEKTQVVVSGKDVFMEAVGRGGGNFEMILPRDFTLLKGDEVVLPGINPYVIGVVETIISDPRDPFIKALLVSPVNIQELKFVQVESHK